MSRHDAGMLLAMGPIDLVGRRAEATLAKGLCVPKSSSVLIW